MSIPIVDGYIAPMISLDIPSILKSPQLKRLYFFKYPQIEPQMTSLPSTIQDPRPKTMVIVGIYTSLGSLTMGCSI